MTWKTVLTLVVAVGLGFATTKIGRDLVLGAKARPEGVKMAKVVVAQRTMDPGYQIQAQDLDLREVPAAASPEASFARLEDVAGRTLVAPVVKGQAMFDGLLAPAGSPAGMEALVPKGMRAVSIEVSESSGMVGLLKPGSRVDVIATLRRGQQSVARTIVENAKVSAVGQRMSRDGKEDTANQTRTVTLVVTPKNAEAIELAGAQGRPRLVLRGAHDTTPTSSLGVSDAELRGETAAAVLASLRIEPDKAAESPKVQTVAALAGPTTRPAPVIAQNSFLRRSVQIIRGGKESTIFYEVAAAGATANPQLAEAPAPAAPTNK